jgi:hypothetical protein
VKFEMQTYYLIMIKCLLLAGILTLSLNTHGQVIDRKHNIVLEIGGFSVPYTIGYERVIKRNSLNELRAKVGIGLIKSLDCTTCKIGTIIHREREIEEIVSLELLNLKGDGMGRLEYGIGFGLTNAYNFTNTFLLSGRIGYRFIGLNNGLNFGFGFNPTLKIAGNESWNRIIPMPGVKIGYGF